MICSVCGNPIKYVDNKQLPVPFIRSAYRHDIPFACVHCGGIKFPARPIRDVCFLWPIEKTEKYVPDGNLVVPEMYQQYLKEGVAILLAIGPGYTNKKGTFIKTNQRLYPGVEVRYNKDVPWGDWFKGSDNEYHPVVMCGEMDIWLC